MPITSPVGLEKIRNEFGAITEWYTDTYNSGSGTITAPAGAFLVIIKCWGGGGGGGGGSTGGLPYTAGGAGAGAYCVSRVVVTGGSTQFTYSVGAGGTGGGPQANGGNGANTTVTSAVTSLNAGGGFGGKAYTGFGGNFGQYGFTGIPWQGDYKYYSGVGIGPGSNYTGGTGGSATQGGSGGLGTYFGDGGNGVAPGGGGAGGSVIQFDEFDNIVGTVGGNGANGRVTFTWYRIVGPGSLSSYTRGGAYVVNYSGYSNISSTSSGLAVSQFLNKENIRVSLPSWVKEDYPLSEYDFGGSDSYVDNTCSGASSSVSIVFSPNGYLYLNDSFGESRRYAWLLQGSASDFAIRFTISTGALTVGVAGDSGPITANITYGVGVTVTCGDAQIAEVTGVVSIIDLAGNVLTSKTIALSASAYSSD